MSVLDEKNALGRSSTSPSISPPGRVFLSGLAGDIPPEGMPRSKFRLDDRLALAGVDFLLVRDVAPTKPVLQLKPPRDNVMFQLKSYGKIALQR
jgi:hypothetical protein